jgi:hypothetical protein
VEFITYLLEVDELLQEVEFVEEELRAEVLYECFFEGMEIWVSFFGFGKFLGVPFGYGRFSGVLFEDVVCLNFANFLKFVTFLVNFHKFSKILVFFIKIPQISHNLRLFC